MEAVIVAVAVIVLVVVIFVVVIFVVVTLVLVIVTYSVRPMVSVTDLKVSKLEIPYSTPG